MNTTFTIADDYDPDGDMSPNADPTTEYRAYLSNVRGGMVGDMQFTLDDFRTSGSPTQVAIFTESKDGSSA
jgi:hypothetical protein